MLKAALYDESYETIQHYAKLIDELGEKHGLEIETRYFSGGDSLLFHYYESPDQMDIILLDIFTGESNGIEVARKLRDSGCTAQIIFLASSTDYVYEAFDVGATQYLLKDCTDNLRFEHTFLKAAELALSQKDERLAIEFDGKITTALISQIAYFEIWKRLVTVYYDNGKTGKFYGSMEKLEKQFAGKGFVRAHRSYLVHLPYITIFEGKKLELKTGETIPVGVTYAKSLKQAFLDYVSRFRTHSASGEGRDKHPMPQ